MYSPTDTENWLKCPAYRDYNKRWHPRDNDWTPARLLGESIAAGLAQFYRLVQAREDQDPAQVEADEAHAVCDSELTKGWVPQQVWTLDGCKALASKGLHVALAAEVLPPRAQVVCVEQLMHRCRPDLVWREVGRGLTVQDWKVRLDLEKKWEEAALSEYYNSWQLRHNAWAVQATFGEPVVACQIGLIVLAPRAHYSSYPVPMSPERIGTWEADSATVWRRMAEEEHGLPMTLKDVNEGYLSPQHIQPPRNLKACWTFPVKGKRCPFYEGCVGFDRDESRFPTLYLEVHKGEVVR